MSDVPTRRRSLVGSSMGLLALTAAAAASVYWFGFREAPPAERAYIAVKADDGRFARSLGQRLGRLLVPMGLQIQNADEGRDVPNELDWDGALAAAETAGARYLVFVEVEEDSRRPGLVDGTTFIAATGRLRVGPVDTEEGEPGATHALAFGAEGHGGADEAWREMVSSFARPMAHLAAGDLFSMPALAALLEEPSEVTDAERRNALQDAATNRAAQERSRTRYDEVCIESVVQGTIDDERGPVQVQCLDIDCGERYLYGLTTDGSAALVHVESPTIYVPFASSPAPLTAETLERLELIPFGEGETRTLAVADGFFGYGSMSADGARVVFVEQARQRFGVVALDVESAERRVLTIVERPGIVVQADISPDGEWVAFHQKAFHRAHTELHVVPFEGGDAIVVSRRTRGGRWMRAPLHPGEEPRQLVAFLGTETYEGTPQLMLVDPTSPDDPVLLEVGDYVIRQVIGANAGKVVVLGSPAGDVDVCVVGVKDPEAEAFEWSELSACIGDAHLTDRFEISGTAVLSREGDLGSEDPEVIIMNLETGDTAIHTTNRADERFVHAADRRIVFERAIRSQFPAVHPNAVCWTTR